ncbi:hypothetical protein CHS0354_004895 [Potamilus streckersoni]|uniref:Uncharacterized protein n=1 Tax=Potamilus streckersoni TaxID=2493646 RepID=A0AAE0SR82_9BIVA|nr:hypothetical protein CHS0354_004895 [Potamilus streckersoni]
MTHKSKKDFQIRMKPYPSHFDLEIKLGFTKDNRRNIIKKLDDEMTTTGFELDAEQTRAYNFLSYVHWCLQERQEAKKYLEKALSKNEKDVMALANQAWILWNDDKFSDAWHVVEKLEKLKDRKDLIIIAKSEQAFAYSRVGPRYYTKAIDTFKEVLKADCGHELDKTHIYLWKFGLGLILKRQLNVTNTFSFDHLSKYVESITEAVDILNDVANNANTVRYQARSWVALGELAYSIHSQEMVSSKEKDSLAEILSGKKPDEFFDKASTICDDDTYVLQRCGKQARYSRNYEKSIEFFLKSIKRRGTSFSHHHLAITLMKVLNTNLAKSSRGSYNGCRKSNSRGYYSSPDCRVNHGRYQNFEKETARRQLFAASSENSKGKNKEHTVSGTGYCESTVSVSNSMELSGRIVHATNITLPGYNEDLFTQFAALTFTDASSPSRNETEPYLPEPNKHNSARLLSSSGNHGEIGETDIGTSGQECVIGACEERKYSHKSGSENYRHTNFDHEYRNTQNIRRGDKGTHSGANRGRNTWRMGNRGRGRLLQQSKSFSGTTTAYQETMSYLGGQGKNDEFRLHVPFETQNNQVFKFMKSPKKVPIYSVGDNRVEEILHHLDKAIEYSPSNCSAMYDKGLVLRSLRSFGKASDLFKEIKKNKSCSKLLAVSCIEQQALCLLEIAEMESKPEIRETLWNDVKELLFRAIEKAARIATQVPHFHPRGTAFPSLREMLLKNSKKQASQKATTLKDLAKLYDLVGEYGQTLSFYMEIVRLSEEAAKDPDIILKMAQTYVKQKDFRDSLLFLDLIEASCTRFADENRKLYFEAYLEGALCALKQNDIKTARTRFKRTVRFCNKRKVSSEDDEEDCTYDIHIVTSRSSENNGARLYNLLTQTCGLKVSLDDNQTTEELKYHGIYEGVSNIMEQSCLVVIFLDNASLVQGELKFYINLAIALHNDDTCGTGIVSISLGDVNVPREIKPFPVFQQPPEIDFTDKTMDEQHQWLKDFFFKAAEKMLKEGYESDSD